MTENLKDERISNGLPVLNILSLSATFIASGKSFRSDVNDLNAEHSDLC